MMRLLKLCVLLIISLPSFTQTNFSLSIGVKDIQGNSIKDYQAKVLNSSATSYNKNGTRTSFVFFSEGTYEIAISAEGFAEKLLSIYVDGNKELEVTLDAIYSKLSDIVVTADKNETSLYKTASSISSINASQVREMRLWKVSDLSGLSPNLYLSNSGDNRNITGIRGIVTTSYDQAVSTYIDGVAQFSLDTYIPQLSDIENIEIIRGAQGTLYGRNAMGGVINITTKKPSNQVSANADIQIGSHGQQRYTAGIKTPIIKNKLFGSLSFMHDKRNGFYTNEYNSTDYDQQNQTLIDVQLRYLINNRWSVTTDHKRYIGNNNGAFPLVNDLDEIFNNPYHLSQNSITMMKDKTENSSIVIKRNGNRVNLSLQTALQKNYRYYQGPLDGDFSSFDIVRVYNNYGKDFNKVNVLTNELRLNSVKSNDSKVNWIAGIYHFSQQSPTKLATVFGDDAGLYGLPETNFALISTNIASNNGIAAYGNVKHDITNKLSVIAGARIDKEYRKLSVKGEYGETPDPMFETFPDTTGKTNFSAFSPKIGLQFNPDEIHLMYVNFSRGFRTGGLSSISSDPSQPPLIGYKPEYSNMFEVGMKGENIRKTFRYAAVLFYNSVTDIQAPALILPEANTIIRNAGKMNSYGAELELSYKPVKGITIQYAGGMTNAKYKTLKGVSNGSEIDLSNKKQVYTPNTTQYIAIQYQVKIGSSELVIRSEYNHVGDQFFDLANQIKQKAYGLFNFRASYRVSTVDLSIWGRNLSGKRYIDYAYDFGAAHLGDPRMIGAGLGWRL
jgi:iron complex outermembrane receptor protein